MGILTKDPVFFQKYLKGYRTASKSPVMKKILANPKIAKALDESREKQEFFNKIKEYEKGGVTLEEVRRALGYFRSGKGHYVSSKEIQDVAGEMISGSSMSDRYKFSSTWDCGAAKNSGSAASSGSVGARTGSLGYSRGRSANIGLPSAIMSKNYNYRRTGSGYSNPTSRVSNVSKVMPLPKKT